MTTLLMISDIPETFLAGNLTTENPGFPNRIDIAGLTVISL